MFRTTLSESYENTFNYLVLRCFSHFNNVAKLVGLPGIIKRIRCLSSR